jgi:subtilisin family serine protease
MRRLIFSAALGMAALTASLEAQTRTAIERADQLPVHSYVVSKAPSILLNDEVALAPLIDSLRMDLEADLAAYDIRDSTALRSYYRSLGMIAMLQGRLDDALAYEEKARPLETKPAARILSGMTLRPLIAAEKAGASDATPEFAKALEAELARMPYDSVQAELKSARARLETLSSALVEGQAASAIDPAAQDGRLSKDLALQLVNLRFSLQVLPYRDEMVRQLSGLINAHRVEKPDIWPARDVSLDGRSELTPVVIAISDVGVDGSLFTGRLWVNGKEIAGNGKDDDGNGYVEDVHGIAWTWNGKPVTGDLRSVEVPLADLDQGKRNMKGFLDMQAGIDSPEAMATKQLFASLSKDDVKPLIENLMFYSVYAHGTHVAGIVARGNPAVRLLVSRFEAPYRIVPPPPDSAWAAGFAQSLERSVAYYRSAGVRIVNMSWGISSSQLEHDLEVNSVGKDQQERRQLAIRGLATVKRSLEAAIRSAPEILFVCAAGNSNESNQFNETIPASFDLPNVITVGAVDQGGDEAAFTSFGKVDLYANGYEVESVLPGGDKQSWSGTSMASPQVANFAAKLLAVYPHLGSADVKKLVIDGTDTREISGKGSIRLLNAARSFELARGSMN